MRRSGASLGKFRKQDHQIFVLHPELREFEEAVIKSLNAAGLDRKRRVQTLRTVAGKYRALLGLGPEDLALFQGLFQHPSAGPSRQEELFKGRFVYDPAIRVLCSLLLEEGPRNPELPKAVQRWAKSYILRWQQFESRSLPAPRGKTAIKK